MITYLYRGQRISPQGLIKKFRFWKVQYVLKHTSSFKFIYNLWFCFNISQNNKGESAVHSLLNLISYFKILTKTWIWNGTPTMADQQFCTYKPQVQVHAQWVLPQFHLFVLSSDPSWSPFTSMRIPVICDVAAKLLFLLFSLDLLAIYIEKCVQSVLKKTYI